MGSQHDPIRYDCGDIRLAATRLTWIWRSLSAFSPIRRQRSRLMFHLGAVFAGPPLPRHQSFHLSACACAPLGRCL